jgi:histidine triad (HIT) family protein
MSTDFYCDEALSGRTPVEVVAESANVFAFRHTRPHWQSHVVVVPRTHIESLLSPELSEELLLELLAVVRQVATEMAAASGGAHVVTNIGVYQDSGHLHFHVGAGPLSAGDSRS